MSGLLGSFFTSSLGITSKSYTNLHILILISNFSTLAPLPILYCIDGSYFEGKVNDEDEENKPLTGPNAETNKENIEGYGAIGEVVKKEDKEADLEKNDNASRLSTGSRGSNSRKSDKLKVETDNIIEDISFDKSKKM